jgi:hypothetical protein
MILVKFDPNWSVHEANFLRFKLEVFIWRRQWNGAKYSKSEIKMVILFLFNSEITVFHPYLYNNISNLTKIIFQGKHFNYFSVVGGWRHVFWSDTHYSIFLRYTHNIVQLNQTGSLHMTSTMKWREI